MPKAGTSASQEHKPTHEEIAARARAIYEQSGRLPGRDVQNWLQAEAELTAGRRESAAKSASGAPASKNSSRHVPSAKNTTASQSYA
jgi:hypothetical protein